MIDSEYEKQTCYAENNEKSLDYLLYFGDLTNY